MALTVEQRDRIIDEAARGVPSGEIAKALGVHPQTVYNIKHNYRGLIIARQTALEGCKVDGSPMLAMEIKRRSADMDTGKIEAGTVPGTVRRLLLPTRLESKSGRIYEIKGDNAGWHLYVDVGQGVYCLEADDARAMGEELLEAAAYMDARAEREAVTS